MKFNGYHPFTSESLYIDVNDSSEALKRVTHIMQAIQLPWMQRTTVPNVTHFLNKSETANVAMVKEYRFKPAYYIHANLTDENEHQDIRLKCMQWLVGRSNVDGML